MVRRNTRRRALESARSCARGALAVCVLALAGPVQAQAPEPQVPRGAGVELSARRTTFQAVRPPLELSVLVPSAWSSSFEQGILAAEPQPNPADLGVLATVFPHTPERPSAFASPEACLVLLGDIARNPLIEASHAITFVGGDGEEAPATLHVVHAIFDDGEPATFYLFHALVPGTAPGQGAVIVLFSGASERLLGPWRATLEDIARSVTVVSPGGAAPAK